MDFAHRGDVVLANWFTFAADGPPLSSVPFPAAANVKATVGTVTITVAAEEAGWGS